MKIASLRYAAGIAAVTVSGVLLAGCSGTTSPASTTSTSKAAATTTTTSTKPATTTTTTTTSPAATATTYTMAQVAEHASATSCWSAVNGSVYDLTAWISAHPGGAQRIQNMCGTDASAAFTAEHGKESQPNSRLATSKLGTLA